MGYHTLKFLYHNGYFEGTKKSSTVLLKTRTAINYSLYVYTYLLGKTIELFYCDVIVNVFACLHIEGTVA